LSMIVPEFTTGNQHGALLRDFILPPLVYVTEQTAVPATAYVQIILQTRGGEYAVA